MDEHMGSSPNGTARGSIGSEGVSDETAEIATPIINTQEGEHSKQAQGGPSSQERLEMPRLLAAFEDSPRIEISGLDDADHSGSSGETEMPSFDPGALLVLLSDLAYDDRSALFGSPDWAT